MAIVAASVLRRPAVWIPAVVLFVGTALLFTTSLEVALVRPFYAESAAGRPLYARWPSAGAQPWHALYTWGILPAWLLGGGGLIVWTAGFFWKRIGSWRDPGLFYALLLIVGPGIIINLVGKPFWNRPRPLATVPFGGQRDFLPVWQFGCEESDASFPCGHAAMGFYLMAPAFVCYRRRPRLAAAFVLLGLTGGIALGTARMAAGCHFPGDILWSGGIVYFCGLALAALFGFGREQNGAEELDRPD